MAPSRSQPPGPAVPTREGGALLWEPAETDPAALQMGGWTVLSFREIRERFIAPARTRGTTRTSLANPAQPLLDLLDKTPAIAVVGVSLRTAADLRDLYGFLIEPAYRRGATLLVASDRDLDKFEPEAFTDPVGYAWTLERLRYVAARFRLGPGPDGLPPLTPIEALLFDAMRLRGLAPLAQYGIAPYRADFAFPDVRIVVECDGRPWHDPERDRLRDAALRRKGWEPLHFTGSEITRDATGCAARVDHEVRVRRAQAESEQPEVVIPVRRSWWARLVAWIRTRLSRAEAPGALAVTPVTKGAPAPPTVWTADLDPEQGAAIRSHDGVVQVIAPAGSGKTTVLVARVRELVARGVPPNRILCCTFNSAAADELQMRLDQAGVEGVDAATFHAVGRRILKRAELLRGDVGSISYGQWRRLAKQAMDMTPEGVWIEVPDARDQVADLKLGRMLTVEEFDEIATRPAERTLAALYKLYEASLLEQDRNDFDDFIFGAVRLLQRDADARRHWQGEYTAVLVDEYQDIEPAQELLIQMIAAPEDLLLCVGDEDQCLYAWRRASVERVIELDQLYPGLERHALARNYRCPTLIVDASRGLISRNRRRFPKQILAARPEAGEIILSAATDLAAQGRQAARLVADLEQGQAVILARTARVLSEIALELAQAGIRFFGPERIKRHSGEPAVLLAYVRLFGSPATARPEDVDAVFRVPNRYLPDEAEGNVASALRSGSTFADAVGRLRGSEAWRKDKLADAGRLFDELAGITDAAKFLHRLRSDGGLDRHYADAEQLNPTDKSAIDTLAHAEDAAAGMTVAEYAAALDYEATIIEQHFDKKGIELSTIHGAKGRQWPLVILAATEEGELPHARSISDADDPEGELEGERRLAYVAFTRASERLVLLHDGDRPSRFITEAALQVSQPVAPGSRVPVLDGTAEVDHGRPSGAMRSTPARTVSLLKNLEPSRPTFVADRPMPPPPRPVERIARIAPARSPDGSIPCSMPGCDGFVGAGFVQEYRGGYAGLCPRYELHDALARRPDYEAAWLELKRLSDEARRRWRAATYGDDDVQACSLPGCAGIVSPDYLLLLDDGIGGLCAQRSVHEALARRDPAVAAELRQLLEMQRTERLGFVPPVFDLKEELLADGGIPCSIPGCDGIVARRYVRNSPEGPVGVCGIAAAHVRLAETDPFAKAELDRLGGPRRSPLAYASDASDLDDLPF